MQTKTQPALEVVHFQSNDDVTDSQLLEAANKSLTNQGKMVKI